MKTLIIGASGYLGEYLYTKASSIDKYIVEGTCCSSISEKYIQCDVLNVNDIDKLMEDTYDVIIWTVMNQSIEERISDIGLRYLISIIDDDTRFIYLSTTVGVGKCQGEDVEPKRRMPDEYLCTYVNGKIDGESIVEDHHNHVIIRPGSIYGFDRKGGYDVRMKVLWDKCETRQKFVRTDNFYVSFVHIHDLVCSILELVEVNFVGKMNIAGALPVSYYEFNRHLAGIIGIDDEFIVPEYLDSSKFNTLSAECRKTELKTDIREVVGHKLPGVVNRGRYTTHGI